MDVGQANALGGEGPTGETVGVRGLGPSPAVPCGTQAIVRVGHAAGSRSGAPSALGPDATPGRPRRLVPARVVVVETTGARGASLATRRRVEAVTLRVDSPRVLGRLLLGALVETIPLQVAPVGAAPTVLGVVHEEVARPDVGPIQDIRGANVGAPLAGVGVTPCAHGPTKATPVLTEIAAAIVAKAALVRPPTSVGLPRAATGVVTVALKGRQVVAGLLQASPSTATVRPDATPVVGLDGGRARRLGADHTTAPTEVHTTDEAPP